MKRTTAGQQQSGERSSNVGSALGPRGRGLLGRVFGGKQPPSVPPQALRREATSIALASGKGGTGKSFIATSLAVVLHQKLHEVTLVDCDFGLACDHLLLGVKPEQTLQHALAAHARLREVRVVTPAGPKLVPGGSGILKMADLSDRQLLTFAGLLGQAAASEDVLLLDVGAGIAPQNMLTLLSADHVVVVTQPEIAALTDAYAVIKCAVRLRPQCRFSVVVNRVVARGQGEATFEKLAQVASKHAGVELFFLGEVGEDPTVTQRRLSQEPVVVTDPSSPTSRAIQGIADRLAEVAGPLARRKLPPGSGIEARFREHRLFLT